MGTELPGSYFENVASVPVRVRMGKQDKLDNGEIEKLLASLHSLATSHLGLLNVLQAAAHYFERNKERMRYPQFRKQGLFVGSGVIEAGCKTVLGRLKQSGMFWTVRELMPSSLSVAVSLAANSRQRVEHYEIAAYGTVRTYAEVLRQQNAASLLEKTLEEEKETDEKLTELAEGINVQGARPETEQERSTNHNTKAARI
jgi:hypothetical protein